MKPRGRIGLGKALGSITGKKKHGTSGSLQSALSVDLENPEVEKIKKDFEMYRLAALKIKPFQRLLSERYRLYLRIPYVMTL